MEKIIPKDKTIIPACDVFTIEEYERIVQSTSDINKVGAYKPGVMLGLGHGLPKVVEVTRKHTSKKIIYDNQKAGNDIPEMGINYAKILHRAGVDAAILFCHSGPETQRAYIEAAFEQGLGVIVGGLMTHAKYVRSESGYIADEAIMEMYLNAAAMGVTDFVVPGNKLGKIVEIKSRLEEAGINPTFYSPGFVAQGGNISDAAKVAGNSWHAIVGRGIYGAKEIKQAALELNSQL